MAGTLDLTYRLLRDLASKDNPRVQIGETARRFNMPAATIQELVGKYGWPNPGSMARAAAVLERKLSGDQALDWSAGDRHPATQVTDVPDPVPAVTPAADPVPGTPASVPVDALGWAAEQTGKPYVGPNAADPLPDGLPSVRMLDIADLIPNPRNPPGRTDDVDDLAASIEEVGQLQPIEVTQHPNRPGWLILFGMRRHAALLKLRRATALCKIRDDVGGDIDQQTFLMLIENIHRKDMNAMEKAYAFGELRDVRGLSLQQIAKRVGLSEGTVSYYVSLLDLDAPTQAKVQTGELPVNVAIQAVKEVRRMNRRAAGVKPVGHPVVIEPPWFTRRHPLAAAVKQACTHTTRPKVGQVGCGQCWERQIAKNAISSARAAP